MGYVLDYVSECPLMEIPISDVPSQTADTPVETLDSGLVVPAQQDEEAEHGPGVRLDWKGDPMIINPGDNMPFF